ncbi:DMT family transporter [Maribius pontilimi]|uniref:DMT family transporter n=2 Tax=Palleronia pontilimi TaxID=1964209 RepID=A0A934MD81_9RHOB|nr:DMT family transporter [Palleronia pontilimi]
MVLAMVGFGIEDALFKAATASVSPGIGTILFGVFGFTGFAALCVRAGDPLWSPHFFSAAMGWRSVFELSGRLFYALALAFAPLSTTSAILQAAPLVVTLGAAAVLGERVGPRRWIAMGVGFAGVLMILRPFGEGFSPTLLFAVAGMLGFAGRDLATRASAPGLSSWQLGTSGFAMVVLAGLLITAFEATPRLPDPRATLLLLGAGIVGVAAYTALTRAMRTGEVSVVAPFRYSRLLVALVLAAILFGERPGALTLIGATLIVGSGLYTLVRSGRAPKTA